LNAMNESSAESSSDILIPYERLIILVFRHEEWLVGDITFYLEFWTKLPPARLKNGDFQSIFTRSASALTPSETNSAFLLLLPFLSPCMW